MEKYICPICQTDLPPNPRYPNHVCDNCFSKATDVNGKKLGFRNTSMDGGYEAFYFDGNEKYDGHICYIEGIKCWADEARLGGIIIEKAE